MKTKNLPIGVFDSGVGGLTVLDALLKALPRERFVYFGDTARVPYGNKSPAVVLQYSREIARYLLHASPSIDDLETGRRIKMLIVACNTASALAAPRLQKELPIPIIGVVEAGAAQAARLAPRGTIAVIATKSTIASSIYSEYLKRLAPKAKILTQACPLFVPLVEEGWVDHPVTEQVARIYLENILKQKPDVLILGCTHYPILQAAIARAIPAKTKVVDSSGAVARQVQEKLRKLKIAQSIRPLTPRAGFYVTDDPEGFRRAAKIFLRRALPGPVKLVRL
ncbi:MAG: glutamate racemase [Elusimicrobiota bacterium]